MIRYFIVDYSCMPQDPKKIDTEGMKRVNTGDDGKR